ncbi:hypothetical protein HNP55_004211 [Paucibacter oligotrophus]|uniref:Uncharacterized protein n=1 Tax=Roseateles oligotrophus TaxID=1769250 RepID=A0A840LI26_9BURK|nr:hypothetical protein [Roseateles oligotrophus]MBB4845659.1 hypothetical protein [Roseateles oligotrophus]
MSSVPQTLALSLLLLTLAAPARAELVEIRWNEAARFAHSSEIAAGKFLELCGKLGPTAAVQWSFKAAQVLNFNIHYHEGEKVGYPAKAEGLLTASGVLKPAAEQDFCWMWSNKSGQAVALTVELAR